MIDDKETDFLNTTHTTTHDTERARVGEASTRRGSGTTPKRAGKKRRARHWRAGASSGEASASSAGSSRPSTPGSTTGDDGADGAQEFEVQATPQGLQQYGVLLPPPPVLEGGGVVSSGSSSDSDHMVDPDSAPSTPSSEKADELAAAKEEACGVGRVAQGPASASGPGSNKRPPVEWSVAELEAAFPELQGVTSADIVPSEPRWHPSRSVADWTAEV